MHLFKILSFCLTLSFTTTSYSDSGGDGSGSEYSHLDNDFIAATSAIEAENYAQAVIELEKLMLERTNDADLYNLLGYSQRKQQQFEVAEQHYLRALEIKPKHRGANEYLGELYLETNRLDKAKERLKVLDKVCFLPCKQYRDLKKAIKLYQQNQS